jgi:hypothetical protein
MPLPFFDESVPFLVVADSVSESLMHVTVMTGGGAGKSSDIGFSMSRSIFRPACGFSLCGGGDPGNSMLGELMGVGCCTTSLGMVSCLDRFAGTLIDGGSCSTETTRDMNNATGRVLRRRKYESSWLEK